MKVINWLKNNKDITAILLIAFILRIIGLDRMSLWVDEVYTAVESNPNFSWGELMNSVFTSDPHPPLYFIIVYFFFKIFGYTAFVLRFISVLMGVAGVWATFRLGRELYNRNVGRYAAILATFNYFLIYYSQEGRMYAMLYLTTTLAFYFLVRFIKQPTNRNLLWYVLCSTLMIYSHLFGVFVLVSQFVILAYFILRPYAASTKRMLLSTIGAGVANLLLYIPVISIILKNRDRQGFWAEAPTSDVFTQYFKDFFGSAEVVVMFTGLLILVFWFQVMRRPSDKKGFINPETDKLIFTAFVLSVWIFGSLLLPLVRSYTDFPIMVNRYFISSVPAILIMIAIGLEYVRSKAVQIGILALILIFSVNDLLLIKQFYRAHYKTQFREAADFIAENNKNNEQVVTRRGFYFPFYLKNQGRDFQIVDLPLENHIAAMMQDSTQRKPFWYADAHSSPFNLSEEQQQFLDRHFSLEESWEGYDAWVRHYVPGSGSGLIDLAEFGELKESNGSPLRFAIDKFEASPDGFTIFGWAFLEGQSTENSKATILLIEGAKGRRVPTTVYIRADVTSAMGQGVNLDKSGFSAKASNIPAGSYKVGILIEDDTTGKKGLVNTGKTFEKK